MKKMIKMLGSVMLLIFVLTGYAFAGEVVTFYHTDHEGTPLAMTDSNGNVVWQADYKPFGEEHTVTGATPNNKRFVGKEKDTESGLSYFDARYEDAKTGRFISVDPVGPVDPHSSKTNEKILLNPQRLNSYAYGLNNPYRYIDPDGRDIFDAGDGSLRRPVGPIGGINNSGTLSSRSAGSGNINGASIVGTTKAAKWGRAETLTKHFQDHGKDFGAKSADEYASKASDFFVRSQKETLPTKISSDGVIRVYEPKSNTFGSYNPDGTTRTFYKPTQRQKYWDRQPGVSP